jgi:hypothetical protein
MIHHQHAPLHTRHKIHLPGPLLVVATPYLTNLGRIQFLDASSRHILYIFAFFALEGSGFDKLFCSGKVKFPMGSIMILISCVYVYVSFSGEMFDSLMLLSWQLRKAL